MLSDKDRDEMLFAAVRADDAAKVQEMVAAYVRAGLDLPSSRSDGTLLHIAASYGAEKAARVLIDAGMPARAATPWGMTPLHSAALHNRPGMVVFLLGLGADIDARTARDLTPLHLSNGTTQLLLDSGADPKALNEDGETAMFNETDVAALVKAGLDVNARNKFGWTPLHVAAFRAQTDHAKALLDHGAEIEAKTLSEYVMRKTEDWTSEDRSIPAGYTALDIAYNEHDRVKWVTGRNRPMIELLRSRGAKRPFLGIPFLRW
jgi:ankyrin repeat protein